MAQIADPLVDRLIGYYRVLRSLDAQHKLSISSEELGSVLQLSPAQVRKDLSQFGRFGRQGRGYAVPGLAQELRHILGLDRRWAAVLVGVGQLGGALASYPGLRAEGFDLIGLYDVDPDMVGQLAPGGLTVRNVSALEGDLLNSHADIGIVAVPSDAAQSIVDMLVASGIRGVLNYSPADVRAPAGVEVRHIDPLLALQSMTYHLRRRAAARYLADQHIMLLASTLTATEV